MVFCVAELDDITLLHPRENPVLYGHDYAEKELLDSFSEGRFPHGWLITGPQGAGKATLAYRIARFLLKGEGESGLFSGSNSDLDPSLEMETENSIFKSIAQKICPDLLVVEPDEAAGRKEITVKEIRKIEHFLSHTASGSGWRVVIIDSADNMNRHSANALLKTLEEPPNKTAIILVSHSPGNLPATIRSRCRVLNLKPMELNDVIKVMENTIPDLKEKEAKFAARISFGSPGLASEIYAMKGYSLYKKLLELLKGIPSLDVPAIYQLSEALADKKNSGKWRVFIYMLSCLLAGAVKEKIKNNNESELIPGEEEVLSFLANQHSVDHLTYLWEKVGHISAETEHLHMDRKNASIQIFGYLREKSCNA